MRSLPWPRSIRARYTVMATVIAAILLAGGGMVLCMEVRNRVAGHIEDDTARVAQRWSAAIREGAMPTPIPVGTDATVDLVQEVAPGGGVLDSSEHAGGRPPISSDRPPGTDRVHQGTACGAHGCVMYTAIRTATGPDAVYVYAGRPVPTILSSRVLESGVAAAGLLLTALTAMLVWRMVGRTLRPVEAIRLQLAEISGSDLSRRVPQPPGDDEIARLARTANDTLARLEGAVEQQRRFASDASHELRSPITGLRVRLEEALMDPADPDWRATVEAALNDTDRLADIVHDLLLLARLRSADPTAGSPVDLAELAAAEVSGRPARPTISISLQPGVIVTGARIQLTRVLANLLDNAQRHAEHTVQVTVARDGDQALLTVTDDGAGVPPDDRERIFERFTRLDESRRRDAGGTGLGLAIARGIATAHGGTLTLEDTPTGARFALRLPINR